jgi:hypothetical protein
VSHSVPIAPCAPLLVAARERLPSIVLLGDLASAVARNAIEIESREEPLGPIPAFLAAIENLGMGHVSGP